MTMATPPLNAFFSAKREREPSSNASGAAVVFTDEARISLSKQPNPGTHVAD